MVLPNKDLYLRSVRQWIARAKTYSTISVFQGPCLVSCRPFRQWLHPYLFLRSKIELADNRSGFVRGFQGRNHRLWMRKTNMDVCLRLVDVDFSSLDLIVVDPLQIVLRDYFKYSLMAFRITHLWDYVQLGQFLNESFFLKIFQWIFE